jgi:hypothetical protein
MTALLQDANASDDPIIIHYNTAAGHSGGRPISEVIDDMLVQVRFLVWQLGIEPGNLN